MNDYQNMSKNLERVKMCVENQAKDAYKYKYH